MPGHYRRLRNDVACGSAQVRSKLAPPDFIQPSRPNLSKKPPTGDLWLHEVKHDGYRPQAHVRKGRVRALSARNRRRDARMFTPAQTKANGELRRQLGFHVVIPYTPPPINSRGCVTK
jgi:hypothetical protein